jgi:hypothetical protein
VKCQVTATYETRTTANKAMSELEEAGFPRNSIKLVIPEHSREAYYSYKASAALWGGGTGAVLAGLFSIARAPPGLLGLSPIVFMLLGCAAGAAFGALAGLLFERGAPRQAAPRQVRRVQRVQPLLGPKCVAVQVETAATRQAEQAERILSRAQTRAGGTALSVTRGTAS